VILLIDEKQGSSGSKKEIASVIAHEMAHQWFGEPGDDEVVGRRLVERRFRNVDVEQSRSRHGNRNGIFNLDDVSQTDDTLNKRIRWPTRVRSTRLRKRRRRLENCSTASLTERLQQF